MGHSWTLRSGTASPVFGDDAPVHLNDRLDRKLWEAVNTDSVAQFAQQYPFTVTPGAPG